MQQVAPPPVNEAPSASLRDRRRTQTLQTIHAAAVDLVARQGPAATTVDQIAAASGVSTRTVFNYYATKEDAALGLIGPTVSEAVIDRFVRRAAEPLLLDRTVEALASILTSMNIPGMDVNGRRMLLETFPELLQTLHARVNEASGVLEHVLERLPDVLGLTGIQRHALRSAAIAVVQEAFIAIDHAHFPTADDLARALREHREALAR
jgi:AcrR family transcriptional regulator